ncbi:MAG: aminotransferase class I/II-fold pyridoxal phosphate-dependent enzyme [Coriobacteriia bacterium]|nr:aminotransferase class I/II-fold pyridoxal phosphate-dependent enzyme [Coriobacteriia bacterium]
MVEYQQMTTAQLQDELDSLTKSHSEYTTRALKLNMSRGKPSFEQLDSAMDLMTALPADQRPLDLDGEDTRNYGLLRGIPEARQLMADYLGVAYGNIILGGSSSLNLMYDSIARAMSFGVAGNTPFSQQARLKFLCPSPGYDRHFAITALFGFENIAIPMNDDGPDMNMVERLVNQDPTVKGIWCVPKYSNPQGITYSDQVVRRFAALKPAAPDFRIYWDNAYAVHDLYPDSNKADDLLSLTLACEEADNPDIWYMFASTAKISFAGGGISALASSTSNIAQIEALMSIQTICPDKVNQLRHVRWFESLGGGQGKGLDGIKARMKQLSAMLAPKFDIVDQVLSEDLGGCGIASWIKPNGGYFISLEVLPGTAKRTVQLCAEAGVTLTDAGATWPYGVDPEDSNIRIAPSYPSIEELEQASRLLAVSARLAAVERLLGKGV